jgi:hypothetical protein
VPLHVHRARAGSLPAAVAREQDHLPVAGEQGAAPGRRPRRGVSIQTIYDKIDFLREQCVAFVAERERQLPGMSFRRLWISSDRQDYVVNWTNRGDRRNVALTAVGSAENRSGYVFAMNLAYDPAMVADLVEERAEAAGDLDPNLPGPSWRRNARLWLPSDLASAGSGGVAKPGAVANGESDAPFPIFNADGTERFDNNRKLPRRGMQIRYEYTVHAHYRLLHRLLAGAARIRFFFDHDASLIHGCLGTFADDILMRRVDAFVVDFDKTLTQDEKLNRVAAGLRYADTVRAALNVTWPLWKVRLFLLTPGDPAQPAAERRLGLRLPRHDQRAGQADIAANSDRRARRRGPDAARLHPHARQPPRDRPVLYEVPAHGDDAGATDPVGRQRRPSLAWLHRLQPARPPEAAGHLSDLLQLLRGRGGQEDAGDAPRARERAGEGRADHLLRFARRHNAQRPTF